MAAVADDYEQALRETDRLRQERMRMEAALTQHREHEKNLQSTLMTAQKLSDDIRANAEVEASASSARPKGARTCCSRRPRRASRTSSAKSTASS